MSSLARVPSLTQHLYLSSTSLPSLSASSLPPLPHLTSLSLANTGLTTILPGAFSQVKSFTPSGAHTEVPRYVQRSIHPSSPTFEH